MIDGIKLLDLSVSVDALLTNDRLQFPLPVDEQTGAVLNRPRRAIDRGLLFTLTPTKAGDKLRCELQGSVHRFSRGGLHNADAFTAADLSTALDDLIQMFQINPFQSRLNNVEFGVNLVLPFPVSQVLDNLISYKYRPFSRVREPGDGYAYYQCHTQRYVVKLYDKGDQYELDAHVLRVEVKVLKMEYLKSRGRFGVPIRLDWLADLLDIANYGPLGALLVETFTEILFDEPTINPAILTARERDIYQNGRNPRFWLIPDDLTGREYERSRKALQRTEKAFRALLNKHRQGNDWQSQTAALIGQTWERLATVNDELLTQINERRAAWYNNVKTVWPERNNSDETVIDPLGKCPKLTGLLESNANRETVEKCPKLTGSADDLPTGEMSQINPLSVVLIWDNAPTQQPNLNAGRETAPSMPANRFETGLNNCSAEGPAAVASSPSLASQNTGQTTRPTATTLRKNADLLAEVEKGRKRYAKGSKENPSKRAAHNLRNDDSNPRNNLARRLRRLTDTRGGQTLPLFTPAEVVRLTPDQRAALAHWQGTRYEVHLQI